MSGPSREPVETRSGTAGLFGWTNVGKSTLLNHLIGDKIAAVADVAQTTRHRIKGVLNRPGGQIVFVDTPGLHRPKHRMNRAMVELARQAIGGVDLAILIADASRGLGEGDARAAELLKGVGVPRMLVLNKIDRVSPKARLLPMMETAVERWGFPEVLPLSALTGEGCDTLVERVLARMPAAPPIYPEDFYTDQTERTLAAERIREKLLERTSQELPHATAVLIEGWKQREDRDLLEIEATILVERESQKPIVIGRGGQLLKQVGIDARRDLEELFGRQVHLRLWVKVRRAWREDERTLRELGLGR